MDKMVVIICFNMSMVGLIYEIFMKKKMMKKRILIMEIIV